MAAEALITVDCIFTMYYVQAMVEEILNIKNKNMTINMDSNNLVEKRLRIDLAALRKDVK